MYLQYISIYLVVRHVIISIISTDFAMLTYIWYSLHKVSLKYILKSPPNSEHFLTPSAGYLRVVPFQLALIYLFCFEVYNFTTFNSRFDGSRFAFVFVCRIGLEFLSQNWATGTHTHTHTQTWRYSMCFPFPFAHLRLAFFVFLFYKTSRTCKTCRFIILHFVFKEATRSGVVDDEPPQLNDSGVQKRQRDRRRERQRENIIIIIRKY